MVLQPGDKYTLNEDGSELMIQDVTKVDEGEYTCTARNKAGQKAQEVSLSVFGKMVLVFWVSPEIRAALQDRSPRSFLIGSFSSPQNHLPEQPDGLRVRRTRHADLRGFRRPHPHHLLELPKQGLHRRRAGTRSSWSSAGEAQSCAPVRSAAAPR